MAETIELFIISKQQFDIGEIFVNNYFGEVVLKEVICLDNWQWENLKRIRNDSVIYNELCSGKIVFFEMESTKYNNLGIYLEKHGDNYEYCLFWNEENLRLLLDHSSQSINDWYHHLHSYLVDMFIKTKISFEYVAIGIESVFQYNADIHKVIDKSKNIVSWIINNKIQCNEGLSKYTRTDLPTLDSVLWEYRGDL